MTEALTHAIKLLSRAINTTYSPDGITVMQNGGIFSELTHLHIHLIPRYKGQNFADFFIEEQSDIVQQATSLPLSRQKLIKAINILDIEYTPKKPLDVDYEIIASQKGFLTEFQKIELNKEIPVAMMVYDSGTSMKTYSMNSFFTPYEFEGIDLVQVVTLTFTD